MSGGMIGKGYWERLRPINGMNGREWEWWEGAIDE